MQRGKKRLWFVLYFYPYSLEGGTMRCIAALLLLWLVTYGHLTDGSHSIRSAIAKNLRCTLTVQLCVLQNRSYCRQMFYIAWTRISDVYCSCDLDLDPMTFVYELDPYSLEIYQMYENELPDQWAVMNYELWTMNYVSFESYHLTHRQADRHDRNYIPRRFAGDQK